MLPVVVNLKAYEGDSWSQTFRLLDGDTPHDLSAATVTAQARNVVGDVVLEVDTAGDPGEITIASSALTAGVYSYDVQVAEADAKITTWVRGQLSVRGDVTA